MYFFLENEEINPLTKSGQSSKKKDKMMGKWSVSRDEEHNVKIPVNHDNISWTPNPIAVKFCAQVRVTSKVLTDQGFRNHGLWEDTNIEITKMTQVGVESIFFVPRIWKRDGGCHDDL